MLYSNQCQYHHVHHPIQISKLRIIFVLRLEKRWASDPKDNNNFFFRNEMVFINHDARNNDCRSDQHLYFVRFNAYTK